MPPSKRSSARSPRSRLRSSGRSRRRASRGASRVAHLVAVQDLSDLAPGLWRVPFEFVAHLIERGRDGEPERVHRRSHFGRAEQRHPVRSVLPGVVPLPNVVVWGRPTLACIQGVVESRSVEVEEAVVGALPIPPVVLAVLLSQPLVLGSDPLDLHARRSSGDQVREEGGHGGGADGQPDLRPVHAAEASGGSGRARLTAPPKACPNRVPNCRDLMELRAPESTQERLRTVDAPRSTDLLIRGSEVRILPGAYNHLRSSPLRRRDSPSHAVRCSSLPPNPEDFASAGTSCGELRVTDVDGRARECRPLPWRR